jgi:hypothetical protein
LNSTGDPRFADLDHEGALKLLRQATLLSLAHIGADGFPRVIPTGFLWNESRIITCTATTAPEVRALAARPEVALSIDGDDPLDAKTLSVRGIAGIEVVDGLPEEFLAAAAKSLDEQALRRFAEQSGAVYRQMARITIEPRWARCFDFPAGRLPERRNRRRARFHHHEHLHPVPDHAHRRRRRAHGSAARGSRDATATRPAGTSAATWPARSTSGARRPPSEPWWTNRWTRPRASRGWRPGSTPSSTG